MAILAPEAVRWLVSPIQIVAALVLLVSGIFDRLQVKKRLQYVDVPFSYTLMPVWTACLILIAAGFGFVVGFKRNLAPNSTLVLVYRSLNVTCFVLCFVIFFWYGVGGVAIYAANKANSDHDPFDYEPNDYDSNFAILAIIFVMSLIQLFCCTMGTFASQNISTYSQFVDLPMEPYRYHGPSVQLHGNAFARPEATEAPSFQRVAQIPPQAIVPVVMAPPAYANQVGATTAPAMLVPTQNTQKEANTAGVGLMYVQVPTNEVLSGNTYAAVPTQVPQMNTYLVGAATSEGIQGTI